MNSLIVIAFDKLEDARQALSKLRSIERQGLVHFEDTALVQRDADGKTYVKNEVSSTTETASAVGAVIGGMITFAFPVAGIAIGAAAGAAVGRSLDRGVSGKFVHEVTDTLAPGRSALFLVVKSAEMDGVLAALRGFHGDVIQTSLNDEQEAALRSQFEHH